MLDFNERQIFATDFQNNNQIQNFINIRPAEAEVFHADRRTDMMKPKDAFRSFANTPEDELIYGVFCTYKGFLCMKFDLKFNFFL